jgi:mRNA-degrading endonuclease RelE of RelBE toxin-antitoxin system
LAYNVSYKKSVSRDLNKLAKAEAARIVNQIEEVLYKIPNLIQP